MLQVVDIFDVINYMLLIATLLGIILVDHVNEVVNRIMLLGIRCV